MKIARISILCCVLFGAGAAYAHHSFAMFDMSKNVTYKGTVVEYDWENPHTHIIVKVPEGVDKATAGTWDIEGGAVNIMSQQGWKKTTFKPGDSITIVAHPMKDGTKGASLFYVVMPDGRRLYHDIARPNADGSEPPRTPVAP